MSLQLALAADLWPRFTGRPLSPPLHPSPDSAGAPRGRARGPLSGEAATAPSTAAARRDAAVAAVAADPADVTETPRLVRCPRCPPTRAVRKPAVYMCIACAPRATHPCRPKPRGRTGGREQVRELNDWILVPVVFSVNHPDLPPEVRTPPPSHIPRAFLCRPPERALQAGFGGRDRAAAIPPADPA